jgi:hypothetical protein
MAVFIEFAQYDVEDVNDLDHWSSPAASYFTSRPGDSVTRK